MYWLRKEFQPFEDESKWLLKKDGYLYDMRIVNDKELVWVQEEGNPDNYSVFWSRMHNIAERMYGPMEIEQILEFYDYLRKNINDIANKGWEKYYRGGKGPGAGLYQVSEEETAGKEA